MSSEEFFNLLEEAIEFGNPVVSYRLPEKKSIQTLAQSSKSVFRIKDFSENGFVFAPFQGNDNPLFIPESEAVKSVLQKLEIQDLNISTDSAITEIKEDLKAKENHINLVASGVKAILETNLRKVVLSRNESQNVNSSAVDIFQNLLSLYPNAFVYIWNHPETGIWLGATPETLLKTERTKFSTMALAGTRKLQEISNNNWTYKEMEEQQIVADSIVFSLKELGYSKEELTVSETYSSEAGSLLHLRTDISGTIKKGATEIGAIIKALHPTPAVCGLPKMKAFKFINDHENYEREYYTGFLGPLNMTTEMKRNSRTRNQENQAYSSIRKDSALFVNLRCMKYNEGKVSIYVGGGITKDSNPQSEWEETVNKTRTMKAAL